MSVSANLIGMPAGGGGSFPMAGTRPKVRKSLTVESGTATWVAPQNVFFINVTGCGGGGSGAVTTAAEAATGGGGGEVLLPSTIQVNPGSAYVVTVGAGGAPKTTGGNGNSGGNTTFTGDIINLIIGSGSGGVRGTATMVGGAGGSIGPANGSLGFIKISGGSGGGGTGSGVFGVTAATSVEYSLGGNSLTNGANYALGGGGASLYGTGSSGNTGTTGSCGPCAGTGGSTSISGRGGSGFFRIVWEE